MRNAGALLSFAAVISASPALHLDSRASHSSLTSKDTSLGLQRRGDLPSVSVVLAALQMQSILPKPGAEPTLASHTRNDPIPASSASLPITTLPYTGPGILILPNSSSSEKGSSLTTTPDLQNGTTVRNPENRSSNALHHFAVVGGAIAGVILFTACLFFLADPRIWKACCTSRQDKLRLARAQRTRHKTIPAWMRIDFGTSFPGKQTEEKGVPTLSPYPYASPAGPKSKFSMASSEYYADSDVSTSFDTTMSSPPLPNLPYSGPGRPTAPCTPSSSTFGGSSRANPPSTPVRPPRPPTADSPAGIESIYYADVDDHDFYRHPNPIVLEPASPIINNPPPMTRTDAQSHLNFLPPSHQFFASNTLGIDALQRHTRSRSAPALDTPSTSRRNSDNTVTSTTGTLESVGSESVYSSVKPHRKSTSAVSWIRYSEFQHQHHLQLQRQSAPSIRRASSSNASPSSREYVGSAY